MQSLSAELIAIIATGVALAGLLLAGQHRLEDRLLAVEKEQARINELLEGAGFTARIQDPKQSGGKAPAPRPQDHFFVVFCCD